MKILHLIDTLDYHSGAQQLRALAVGQSPTDPIEICCLGPDTETAHHLRQAGVVVHTLGWTHWFDFGLFWNLRDILRDSTPDVIHVWGLPALRVLVLVAPNLLSRAILSGAPTVKKKLGWWDRRLLERVRCLSEPGLRAVVPVPGVHHDSARDAIDPNIVCVGPFEHESGFREAIWAFDFVLYHFPDARLQLVGSGSQRDVLQRLAVGLHTEEHVQFLPPTDSAEVFGRADLVWIPSLSDTGAQVALEAMTFGCAIIASEAPSLRELIRDGETGFLIPPGHVVQLARRTKVLCDDANVRRAMGHRARAFVAEHHALGDTVARWQAVYRQVAV